MESVLSLASALMVSLFIAWNNWPELLRKLGLFLVAQSRSIKQRKIIYANLLIGKGEEVHSVDRLLRYNDLDVLCTWQIWEKQQVSIGRRNDETNSN